MVIKSSLPIFLTGNKLLETTPLYFETTLLRYHYKCIRDIKSSLAYLSYKKGRLKQKNVIVIIYSLFLNLKGVLPLIHLNHLNASLFPTSTVI